VSGLNPAVLKTLNREFVILLKLNQMRYSPARRQPFLLFAVCMTFVGFSLAFATLTAPKCSSSSQRCSKSAANSENVLELETEGWVSG
jgi:hypothetical protein